MKKWIAGIMSAIVCSAAIFGGAACGKDKNAYSVYAPDGAPALALAHAISKQDSAFEYRVIDAQTVAAQVTGANPAADFCVLPLNAASKLLGTGESYSMLGTVTNGNLYFLTVGENDLIDRENVENVLLGKKVGVVQLANVPGLTLQTVLADRGIPYRIMPNVNEEAVAESVNLVNLGTDAANVTPVYGCDYYLCPEPAASTKIKGTANSPKPFVFAGDLQKLYGSGNGYPQAVLVAKNSVIRRDRSAVTRLISYFQGSAEFLKTVQPEQILSLLADKRTAGLTPSFDAKNLTSEVIVNCSVRFTAAQDCKQAVNSFLAKLIAVNPASAAAVSEAFFFAG